LKYFHLLGIALHFSEDPNLRNTLFLDPNWTVDAVYSVLSDPTIENNNGVFNIADLDRIWSKKGYGYEEREKLLQLMLKDKFDLCYKLPGSENKYIVPLLLPKIKPGYDWENKDNLQFRFQYPFMPKGIVSRLIVRLNEFIEGGKVWNEGAVFHKDGARAQVIERETTKEGLKIIEIRLTGNPNNRKEFLTIIREELHQIQNSSFPNLPYYEMVPCNCSECVSGQPEFYAYEGLENLLYKGIDKKQCPKSGIMVDIVNLIDAVYKYDRSKEKEHNKHSHLKEKIKGLEEEKEEERNKRLEIENKLIDEKREKWIAKQLKIWRRRSWIEISIFIFLLVFGIFYIFYISDWSFGTVSKKISDLQANALVSSGISLISLIFTMVSLNSLISKYRNYDNIKSYIDLLKEKKEYKNIK
jgi:hypothetical protein